jgi:hypothetical protein
MCQVINCGAVPFQLRLRLVGEKLLEKISHRMFRTMLGEVFRY